MLPRQIEAETAIHQGDPEPRLALWSHNDPVTILGALGNVSNGREEVERTSRWVAARFSDFKSYRFELVAAGASGDLAYMVGYEIYELSFDGGPLVESKLRATHAYRREDGEWKIAHRHADPLGTDPAG